MNQFDFESLTLEEVELIENLTNSGIDEAFGNGKPKGKALAAFVWVVRKRNDPNYKMEDAKKLSLKDALAMIQGEEAKKE
jgi:ribonuclease HII